MNPSYLHTGDLVTLSFEGLYLGIESLTQSIPIMKQINQTPINSYFLLTTRKCYETSIQEQKSLTQFKDDEIYYGQAILFYHLLSGKFLSYSRDIENKSTIQLTSGFKPNCEFSIKPIFKCQTVVTRKIRSEQSVILAPLETFNRQGNISLVVVKNEARKQNRYFVCMKKNEHTMLNLQKVNSSEIGNKKKISSINIYQISNIETKKNLFAEVSQTKHRDIFTFQKSINELPSYFVFKPKNSVSKFQFSQEKQLGIEYCKPIYIYSWKEKRYLGINLIGDMCLSREPSQETEFTIQGYNDIELTSQSVVRIKHVLTQKYISMNYQNDDIQAISEARLIDTYFLTGVPVQNLRLNIFVNDAHKIIENELMNEPLTYRNKRNLSKVLKQLTNFIYGDLTSISEFMSMKSQVHCKLFMNDQKLLADVGMIEILLKVFKRLIQENDQEEENGNEFEQKDRTDQHNIISYVMMDIAGICLKNPNNMRGLIQDLPILYGSMGSTDGAIQCLYHLFKDSKELLLILQNTVHKINKKQILSFEILLNSIIQHKFEIPKKCKILKLLEALIITSEKYKVLSHLTILISYMKDSKMENLYMKIQSNDHYDLMVYLPQKKGLEELDQMLTMKKTYDKQLQLLKNQLQLICGLSYNSSTTAFKYISSMFPQQMILRYLKANIQPDFKQIFMRLLIDIYLSKLSQNFSTSKAFIIINQQKQRAPNRYSQMQQNSSIRSNLIPEEDDMIEMSTLQHSHSKTIEKIQNLILQITRKAIVNQIIDSSFYMNIKALRKFLGLRILDQQEVQEFRALLTRFISSYIENSFKEVQKKKIILQILSIMKDYINRQIEETAQEFVLLLKSYDEVDEQSIYNVFMEFTKHQPLFNNEIINSQFRFLPQLIRQSLKNQQEQICLQAQNLCRILYERHSIFIRSFKDKIIIESNWSINFFNRVSNLKKNLVEQIQEFIGSQRQQKKAAQLIQENLNRKLQQLNFMFYETENENIKTFSSLVQNIFREMNLFEIIIGFLNDSQKQFKKQRRKQQRIDVFSTCFQFISMFLRDNQNNFQRLKARFLDIKFVFQYPDRGQIKFLNHLIKMPKVRSFMIDQILQCVMMSFQYNTQPNPFTILSLLNILTYPHIDKERLELFVQSFIRKPEIFLWIFKIKQKRGAYEFIWSYKSEDANYHKDWIIYITLVFKLLLVILENSSERTTIAIEIIKYLDLTKILNLLQCPDILSSISLENLEGVLLKKYIMKIFTKIYLSEVEKSVQQVENILAYVQASFQNLAYLKEDVMGASAILIDEIMKSNNDHEAIIYESEIYPKSKFTCKYFQTNFNHNYLIVIRYYPFLVKILDLFINSSVSGSGQSLLKREATMLMDSVYRKYKQFVNSRLTYGEFNKFSKDYKNSIYATEELFKRKIGFNLEIDDEEEDAEGYEAEIRQIFINRKIQNTIKCFQFASNRKEKRIYEAFITMFHSKRIQDFIELQEKKYELKLSNDELVRLVEFYEKYISFKKIDCLKILSILEMLLEQNEDYCRDMEFNALREKIMIIFENEKEDLGNQKLRAYLSMNNKLFQLKIFRKSHSKTRQKLAIAPFKDGFLSRICKELQLQSKLYSGSKLNEQCMIYVEKKRLTFERVIENLTIEETLQWIRNMSILIPYKAKLRYSQLFFTVADLLKVYCDFIREFNSKYISHELYHKICLCLQIVCHYIGGVKEKNILVNYLIERQIWNDLNMILNLDDSWNKNIEELNDTIKETFAKAVRSQVRFNSRSYLSQAQAIYLNSKAIYGNLIPDQYFPFLPIKSFFGIAKSNSLSVLKEFNHYTLQVKQQVYSRMQMHIINKNIYEIYNKHEKLFTKYEIPSVEIDIDYKSKDELRPIAENLILENGVDLTSLKLHIEDLCSNGDVKTEYYNLRLDAITSKKIKSAFSSIGQFIRDFFMLFLACFIALCRKNKRNIEEVDEIEEKKLQQIIKFFLQKLGRVELTSDGKLFTVDFMIRPQCHVNRDLNKKFIEKINFVSMQLKIESIYRQGRNYMLYYRNQINFYRKFNSLTFLTFLTKNFEMITYLNFGIIVWQNIVLILNSNSDEQYFVDTSITQPFVWLQIASTIGAGLILIAYFIKDFPLLLQMIDEKLKLRSESYGSNFNNYNVIIKIGIKISMVILDPRFAYHFIYSLIVALVFYNKLFVALLLLDVYFQIPNLKNLLMSIWRPKLQLFLAIVSFVLVQYFFSIFMFFNFKTPTAPYCNTLGSCFGFVFVTTYKAVGGFVGYLFQREGELVTQVDFFEIFQDIYVVLVYQIFFALILAIIIDTFSLIRNEQSARKQYLDGCCIVCNLDKTKFNSATVSFRSHIAISHNIWNYFYYYEYIFHKDIYRRSIYEREIVLSNNANWLPNNTSSDVIQEQAQLILMKGN